MSMQIQLGPKAFVFTNFEEWVNKAQSWFATRIPDHAKAGRRYICLDAIGRVCLIGRDFMRARDEKTFPVAVFLIDSDKTDGVVDMASVDTARMGNEALANARGVREDGNG